MQLTSFDEIKKLKKQVKKEKVDTNKIQTENERDKMYDGLLLFYIAMETEMCLYIADYFYKSKPKEMSMEWYIEMSAKKNQVQRNVNKIYDHYKPLIDEKLNQAVKVNSMSNIDKEIVDSLNKKEVIDTTYKEVEKAVLNNENNTINKVLDDDVKKAVNNVKRTYDDILNDAYIEVSNGNKTYDEAIQDACNEAFGMGMRGKTFVRKNGKLFTQPLETCVRRDLVSTLNKVANENSLKMCKELGTNLVEVSAHLGARTNDKIPIADHYGWQGKVYMIEGKSKKYGNLVEETGYGDILGLSGVNCRHRMFPHFEGETNFQPLTNPGMEENAQKYAAMQEQRKLERSIRKVKRLIEICKITKNYDKEVHYEEVLENLYIKIEKHCIKNDLRRDYQREQILL